MRIRLSIVRRHNHTIHLTLEVPMRPAIPLLFVAVLSACAINQTVRPVPQLQDRQVCIVENPAVVMEGFLETYEKHLQSKGYSVKRLPPNSPLTSCPTTSTYTANWRWDLAMYMAFAEITVYSNGQEVGKALYDSLRGGANMSKFIRGEEKIKELVDQLFPK